MKISLPIILFTILLIIVGACNRSEDLAPELTIELIQENELGIDSILLKLASNYIQLPEQEIAISNNQLVFAQYASPTKRYTHGIMGDAIEASDLVVVVNDNFYNIELSDNYVFEDIRPRLANVDEDEALEFICIRSHLNKGAGIVIYKLGKNGLYEYAFVPEIGIRNRWLNIVAIQDLDDDKKIELAWIETPHIGGILKVAEITEGELQIIDEVFPFSNHAIGETNLCLSVINIENDNKVVYVPSQDRQSIVGFRFEEKRWIKHFTVTQPVNFSEPLTNQYTFTNILVFENNCIHP